MTPRAVVLLVLLVAGLGSSGSPAIAQTCDTAAACVGVLDGLVSGGWTRIYQSAPLDARHEGVTEGLVIVHGGGRDADRTFDMAVAAARAAGTLDTTLIVSPRLASNDGFICDDAFDDGEVAWGCQGNNGWAAGAVADGHDPMDAAAPSTYDVVDALLRRLADRDRFPALERLVVAGFSAGGQFVARYSMANTVDGTLGVPVAYVVGSPASYAYPDATRPVAVRACPIANIWPYGLDDRRGYSLRLDADELRAQLARRDVTYLLGERDTRLEALDTTCAGRAQGLNRVERGLAFAAHLRDTYGATHAVEVVPGCGHDGRCVFTSPAGLAALFPPR
jgi:hypothetical protein